MKSIAEVIRENPDLPIIVDVEGDYGEYYYVKAEKAEVVNMLLHPDYRACQDEEELRYEVEDRVYGRCIQLKESRTEADIEKEIDGEMEALKPYWQKVIVIYTGGEWL